MQPRHIAIAGMAYGDEGKGTMVDFLARFREAKLVVRFNGGQNAGHNVVTPEGLHHCASQWGAGVRQEVGRPSGTRTRTSEDNGF